MIGLFKQKSPANIVLLLIFGLLIKLPLFLYPRVIVAGPDESVLYRSLLDGLTPAGGDNALRCALVAFSLLYVQALLVNYLVNEYRLTTKQTFLPAMAYLLITSLLPEWSHFSAPLLATTLVIWSFIKLFRLYNLSSARGPIFNIGMLAGLASFIYFPSVLFAVCLLLGLMILKPFRFNEVVLFLVGCITPLYFYAVYLFLDDRLTVAALFPSVRVAVPVLKSSIPLAVSTLLLGVPFLVGGYYVQLQLRKMLIQVRKNWSILLLYLFLAIFVPFINSRASLHNWVLAAAPFAAFHACAYLYPVRRWLPLTLFSLTLGFVLYLQFFTATWR